MYSHPCKGGKKAFVEATNQSKKKGVRAVSSVERKKGRRWTFAGPFGDSAGKKRGGGSANPISVNKRGRLTPRIAAPRKKKNTWGREKKRKSFDAGLGKKGGGGRKKPVQPLLTPPENVSE